MQHEFDRGMIEQCSTTDQLSHSALGSTLSVRVIVCLVGFLALALFSSTGSFAADAPQKQTRDDPRALRRIIETEPVPDKQLEDRIRSVLVHVDDFKDVEVTVSNGVVRLEGKIARTEAKDKLEQLVARFRGVLYVDDKIKSATDVETRVSPVLDRLRDYAGRILEQLPLIAVAALVTALCWFLGWLISRIAPRYGWFGINPMMKNLISRLFMFIFVIIGIIIALDILDVTALVGAVVGTAGIAGLAIGFAFKDIVENYLAGLLLSIRGLFSINDHVAIGEYEGRVVRLTSREIVVMTLDGNHVLIPNSTVFKSVIVNFTRNDLRRFEFAMGVGVSEDLVTVRRVGEETLRGMKGVIDDPGPFMRIDALGDFAVIVRFFGWINQRDADLAKVRGEAIRLVKAAFDEAGIEMPFPTYVRYTSVETTEEIVSQGPAKPPLRVVAATADVSVDTQLDRQIEEDLKSSPENNYLKKSRL